MKTKSIHNWIPIQRYLEESSETHVSPKFKKQHEEKKVMSPDFITVQRVCKCVCICCRPQQILALLKGNLFQCQCPNSPLSFLALLFGSWWGSGEGLRSVCFLFPNAKCFGRGRRWLQWKGTAPHDLFLILEWSGDLMFTAGRPGSCL